eukprot:829927-Pelagomonas_calceolata.AAC.1
MDCDDPSDNRHLSSRVKYCAGSWPKITGRRCYLTLQLTDPAVSAQPVSQLEIHAGKALSTKEFGCS